MYLIMKQPKTLIILATKQLAHSIASQAEKLLSTVLEIQQDDPDKAEELISHKIVITRSHLESHLPGKLHDMLVIETVIALKATWARLHNEGVLIDIPAASKMNVIGRMIEVLFTKSVTSLSLYTWTLSEADMNMFLTSFCTNAHLLRGLTQLYIRIKPANEADLVQALSELTNLKHLSLKFTSGNIIKSVAENCKLLETLELANLMFDENVQMLSQLTNLKSLCLIRPILNEKGMQMLLSTTGHIETEFTLSLYDGRNELDLSPTLRLDISFNEKNDKKQFNLMCCERLSVITLSQLKLIVKICPQIQRICLKKYSKASWFPIVLNRLRC